VLSACAHDGRNIIKTPEFAGPDIRWEPPGYPQMLGTGRSHNVQTTPPQYCLCDKLSSNYRYEKNAIFTARKLSSKYRQIIVTKKSRYLLRANYHQNIVKLSLRKKCDIYRAQIIIKISSNYRSKKKAVFTARELSSPGPSTHIASVQISSGAFPATSMHAQKHCRTHPDRSQLS
jgi:hypothetical protein